MKKNNVQIILEACQELNKWIKKEMTTWYDVSFTVSLSQQMYYICFDKMEIANFYIESIDEKPLLYDFTVKSIVKECKENILALAKDLKPLIKEK